MQSGSRIRSARATLSLELKRAQLQFRKQRAAGDLFVDYGWIRLLYSGDSDDQEIAYHLHQRHWHEKDMQVFRSLLAPGQTAIDIGANLGFITAMLASIVGPDGRVLAFEPAPAVFVKLQKTLAVNGLDQVTPMNFGCGAARSVTRLHQVNRSSGNASIVSGGRDAGEIRLERLDDVAQAWATRVSLLKIDTEGYEPEILQGARRLIADHRPIIYLEMGGDYVASTLRSMELLAEAGYGIDHVRSIDWSAVGNGSNYFFFPG